MTDWFTADLHLGHDTVARMRGFPGSKTHDELVLSNIAEVTNPGDRLWILGDLTKGDELEGQYISVLSWRIKYFESVQLHVILGNHDSAHPMRSKAFKKTFQFTEHVDSVASLGTLKISGQRAVLSHYPYDGDHTGEDRDIQWRARDLGAPIIHGHTHASEPVSWSRQGSLQICVSLDAWGMRPVSKDALTRLIERNQKKENG